jgi:L-amino acid N-acyltransferase YncA
MELLIREAQVADAQGIIDLLNPIIIDGKNTALDTAFTLEEEELFIRNFPESGIFNIAFNQSSSSVVGFQNVEPFAGFTHSFDHVGVIGTYVATQFRRQGVASRLFEATFSLAKAKGYEKLFAYVRADNENALKNYLKQGFEVIGTAKKHAKIRGEYIDEIFIERQL